MHTTLNAFYILHARPFKETSLLLDCISVSEGRMSLVAKGAKRPKSGLRGLLQPFTPLVGQWLGKRDLKTLVTAEARGANVELKGDELFMGFYVNELLVRLTAPGESMPIVFQLYDTLLQAPLTEVALRQFEFGLLHALGYGISLTKTLQGETIIDEGYYVLDVSTGFIASDNADPDNHFSGKTLRAIANQDFENPAIRQAAKLITRCVLKKHLGDQPLKSREMLRVRRGLR